MVFLSKNKRIGYIDCAKFIGIFLLLFEHTGNWVDISGSAFDITKSVICSFHMPLFFIIYGMVSSRRYISGTREFFNFFENKFRSLIVPYIIWCLIYAKDFGVHFLGGIIYGNNWSLSCADTNAVLWFLPAMFVSTLLYQITIEIEKKFSKYLRIVILLECIVLLLMSKTSILFRFLPFGIPWGVDIACLGTVYIILGNYIVKPIINFFIKKLNITYFLFMILSILSGVALSIINRPSEDFNDVVIMAVGKYGKSELLGIFSAIFCVIGIVLFCNIIENKVFNYIGESSLIVMVSHYIIFPYSIRICKILLSETIPKNIYIILFPFLNSVIVCLVCLLLIWGVNRYAKVLKGKY